MGQNFDSSGFDLVEILGEFIGDDSGDDYSGDELSGDEIGAINRQRAVQGRRPVIQKRPGWGGRPAPRPQMDLAKRALTQAIAERRAQAGALLTERHPTRAREYPLGFVSAAAVPAGGFARITTRPQVPFRLDRLVVPSDLAGLFTIDDVKVGKNSQFAAEGSVPARIFQENAVGVCLKGDTAQVSMDVTLSVTNISGAAAFFRAAIIGPAVE